jgi:hypothetical protein
LGPREPRGVGGDSSIGEAISVRQAVHSYYGGCVVRRAVAGLVVCVGAACSTVEPIGPGPVDGTLVLDGSVTEVESSATETDWGSSGDTGEFSESAVTDSGTWGTGTWGTSDTSTGTGTSGSTGTETGPCPIGAEGCPCTQGGACDRGLHCDDEVCVAGRVCPPEMIGSEGCQCTLGGGCDPGLECLSDICVEPG